MHFVSSLKFCLHLIHRCQFHRGQTIRLVKSSCTILRDCSKNIPYLVADSSVSPTGLKWAAPSGGLPNSTSFTATPTGFASPILTCRYVESGDSVFYYGLIDFTASTTYSGNFTLNLPATASMNGGARFQGLGECFISDWSAGIDYSGYAFIPTSTTLIFGIPKTNSTYLSDIPAVANGTPISFANNDQLYFYIWYRKA